MRNSLGPALVFAVFAGFAFVGASTVASGANLVIVNNNAAGVGFNDASAPNPAAGCNAGETIGLCRLRVFNQAAAQWGNLLQSNVTIQITGSMEPLTCSSNSAVLGSAGPNSAHANFPNAPRANVAYVQALANSLAGSDLSASADLLARFNVTIDTGCLSGVAGWWYGTNPAVPVPNDRTPLLPVVFHELGHGLGFVSLYSPSTGVPATGSLTPIWGFYLYDTETGKLWKDMTDPERVASAINDPDLVWAGPLTNAWSPVYLGPSAIAMINAPGSIAGVEEAQTAEFGPGVSIPTTADVVLVNDGVGTARDGCETPFINASRIFGKIALIERGTCKFSVKVKNAQLNGAVGALIFNNAPTGLVSMGGDDPGITIPSLGVSQALGNSIISTLPMTVNATLGVDALAALPGTQNGCVRMYAPTPVQEGSSVSHFHSDAFPNLLMEPILNRSIFNKVDLTWPLFKDIGWNLNVENVIFRDTFDRNPCLNVQP